MDANESKPIFTQVTFIEFKSSISWVVAYVENKTKLSCFEMAFTYLQTAVC
jgi:hypothetical protein